MTEIARLEKKMDRILQVVEQSKKPRWVKASILTDLTIFHNNEKLRQARDNGYVKYKDENGSFSYDLNSIHEKFFK